MRDVLAIALALITAGLLITTGTEMQAQVIEGDACAEACYREKDACVDECHRHVNPVECDSDCRDVLMDCLHEC